MRWGLLLVVACALPARAHVFAFDFVWSRPIANYAGEGGVVALQWVDSESPGAMASARIYVSRRAWSPLFGVADAGEAAAVSETIWLASPVDALDWNTAGASEGCWQPYAEVADPVEGYRVFAAPGRVTVARGSNVPPALWVTTRQSALPDSRGVLQLEWDLDEPDDDSVTTVTWFGATGASGTLASALTLPAGTRTAAYAVDVNVLPQEPVWLHLEVASSDGRTCDAWWSGFVFGRAAPGAGDAPAAAPDAGQAISFPAPQSVCSQAGGSAAAALLLLTVARTSRSGRRPSARPSSSRRTPTPTA